MQRRIVIVGVTALVLITVTVVTLIPNSSLVGLDKLSSTGELLYCRWSEGAYSV